MSCCRRCINALVPRELCSGDEIFLPKVRRVWIRDVRGGLSGTEMVLAFDIDEGRAGSGVDIMENGGLRGACASDKKP